jgi:hypothetical protein
MPRFRPARKEIIITSVIFAMLIIVVVSYATFETQSPSMNAENAGSLGSYNFAQAPSPVYSNGQGQNLDASSATAGASYGSDARVVATSEAIVGYVNHNTFENVSGQIITKLAEIGGYVNSSNLMYNGTAWFGIYVVDVPPTNATSFLFQVKNLIDQNGKTTSIQIETQDVTNQTGGNQSRVPFSPFSVTLQELASGSYVPQAQQQSQIGFFALFSGISAILILVLEGATYVVLIAVPMYLLILGGVVLSRRLLYPVLLRISSRHLEATHTNEK